EHLILLLVIVALVLGCAFLIEFVEGEVNPDFREFSQALRWSLFSLVAGEPVGGTPQTTIGWMIQFGVMLGGITVFAVFTGIVAAMMTQTLTYRMEDKMLDMEDLENHIVLCGWNRMAPIIIKELQADPSYRQCPIVVIAEFGEHEPDLSDPKIDETTIFVVKADYTTIEALEHARIERAQTAIILADKLKARSDQDRDARTVLAALTIEKLNKQIFTCIELLNRKNAAQLQMIGVEEIVVGDEYSANIFASASRNQGLVALVNEIFTPRYGNQFYKYDVPEGWYGRRVGEIFLPLKEQANALLTAVEICRENDGRIERSMKVNPPLDFTFTPCQKVVVMAKEEIDLTKVDPAGVKPT
ncbi:MAG: potassium channel protein, partial [Deltaproteobacteria bacterium]